MAALKGTQPPGGSRKGIPNKLSADVRAMILAALDRAGGEDYLLEQATANPRAFLSLVGRILPTQVTGKDDTPLIPESASDLDRVTGAFLAIMKTLPEAPDQPADPPQRPAGDFELTTTAPGDAAT
jgi:hypothetical protein